LGEEEVASHNVFENEDRVGVGEMKRTMDATDKVTRFNFLRFFGSKKKGGIFSNRGKATKTRQILTDLGLGQQRRVDVFPVLFGLIRARTELINMHALRADNVINNRYLNAVMKIVSTYTAMLPHWMEQRQVFIDTICHAFNQAVVERSYYHATLGKPVPVTPTN
jgi:hypothetical protein